MALGKTLIEYSVVLIPTIRIVKFTIRFSALVSGHVHSTGLPYSFQGRVLTNATFPVFGGSDKFFIEKSDFLAEERSGSDSGVCC